MTIKAKCGVCGKLYRVEEPKGGQSLYGTMADKMATHESKCAISSPKQWWWDHGGPETSVEGAYEVVE